MVYLIYLDITTANPTSKKIKKEIKNKPTEGNCCIILKYRSNDFLLKKKSNQTTHYITTQQKSF